MQEQELLVFLEETRKEAPVCKKKGISRRSYWLERRLEALYFAPDVRSTHREETYTWEKV